MILTQKDAHWKAFGSDPQWKKISAMPEYADALLVSKITSTMLIPTVYSTDLSLAYQQAFQISSYSLFFINLISYYMEKNKHTFSEAEIELLKEGLKRSYKERFEMATRLYKIQQTMSKASIVHKPFISK
jgi:hypothetical protein